VIGKPEQSVQEMKRALELDPVSLVINLNVGDALLFARRPDEAPRYYEAALEMDPVFSETHQGLGRAYLQKGDFERAIVEFEKARELSHDSVHDLSQLETAYALAGKPQKAMSMLSQLEAMPNVPSYIFARLYVCMGEKKKALAALQEAYWARSSLIIALKSDPVFDPLRNEPGFQNILKSIGLTP